MAAPRSASPSPDIDVRHAQLQLRLRLHPGQPPGGRLLDNHGLGRYDLRRQQLDHGHQRIPLADLLSTQPATNASVSAGAAIPVTATVEDQFGNPVLINPNTGLPVSYSVTLTASGPSTAIYGTDAMTAVNGVAAFNVASDVNLHNEGDGCP